MGFGSVAPVISDGAPAESLQVVSKLMQLHVQAHVIWSSDDVSMNWPHEHSARGRSHANMQQLPCSIALEAQQRSTLQL